MLGFVGDPAKQQHDRHFGQHTYCRGKRRRGRRPEQCHRHSNGEFKEIGDAYHTGRCGNIVRQFQ